MSKAEVNLNLMFLINMGQILFFNTLFSLMSYNFMTSPDHKNSYFMEDIGSERLYSAGIWLSFWFILMRYIPFDVIIQTEGGKIIYSKFMEWDL